MNTFRRYLPVTLWCAVIFFFSSLETTPTPKDTILNFLLKKSAHIIEYAVLYHLAYRTINNEAYKTRSGSGKFRKLPAKYLYPLLFTIAYAISDEIHQSFIPGRHARWYDVAIFDAAGALLALRFNIRK